MNRVSDEFCYFNDCIIFESTKNSNVRIEDRTQKSLELKGGELGPISTNYICTLVFPLLMNRVSDEFCYFNDCIIFESTKNSNVRVEDRTQKSLELKGGELGTTLIN
ncbi:hypothetical protein ACFFRR_003439 [Megaselia abdita]